MSTNIMEGRCLCGAVSVQAQEVTNVEACHCGMCRQWGGGPFLSVQCGTDVKFTGAENIAEFDSSDWASRAFCKICGTHLYYFFKPARSYAVPAGLFQGQDGFHFREQIFVDKKPDYYEFANKTECLTEAQVLQKYAPK